MPHHYYTSWSKSHLNNIYDYLLAVYEPRVVAVLSMNFARICLGWRLGSHPLVTWPLVPLFVPRAAPYYQQFSVHSITRDMTSWSPVCALGCPLLSTVHCSQYYQRPDLLFPCLCPGLPLTINSSLFTQYYQRPDLLFPCLCPGLPLTVNSSLFTVLPETWPLVPLFVPWAAPYYQQFTVHSIVHGPEQILVPSGWAKLGNVFRVHTCPVHYLSHDRPLNSAAFMWLSPMLIILFPKNNIFVFFNDFQIIFKLKPSSMIVLIKYNCSNTSWYPFRLYVSISLKKGSNCDKFMQKFLPFHNQWKIWTASLNLILRL